MKREGRLEGRVALVTGVAKTNSIGFATCGVFAEEGAALAIIDIADKVHECAELLRSRGCEVSAHTADLTKSDQVRTAVGDAVAHHGRLDVLVNNAGMAIYGTDEFFKGFAEITEEEWDFNIAINLKSQFNVTQAVLPGMLERGYGRIVNISSVTGPLVANPEESAYCAAKAGVLGMTRALALEVAKRGITVNAVGPGWVDTGTTSESERIAGQNAAMGRAARPEEIGIKIHSAVYATTPAAAGDLAAQFLGARSSATRVGECEVMDIDEEAFRAGHISASLYGYLRVPFERALLQSAKMGSVAGDATTLAGIAADVVNDMRPGSLYIVGPGTTARAVVERLGLVKTLLGVDVVCDGLLVAADVTELDLLNLLSVDAPPEAHIVVTVIGGQGHIFGRGNQQISPAVIRACGVANITVVATQTKLLSLQGRPLLCDSGDPDLDGQLSGYAKVITGPGERTMYRVAGNTVAV